MEITDVLIQIFNEFPSSCCLFFINISFHMCVCVCVCVCECVCVCVCVCVWVCVCVVDINLINIHLHLIHCFIGLTWDNSFFVSFTLCLESILFSYTIVLVIIPISTQTSTHLSPSRPFRKGEPLVAGWRIRTKNSLFKVHHRYQLGYNDSPVCLSMCCLFTLNN